MPANPPAMQPNTLYFGDNLQVLREHFPDESVDLVYLDPPFNSDRNYNLVFSDAAGDDDTAQIQAFSDTWSFEGAAEAFYEITAEPAPVGKLLEGLRQAFGDTSLLGYLSVMALRLRELHRVLKPTGSLYLHCDPTAGHYLKLVLDSVFHDGCVRNEVIWHYRKWSTGKHAFQRNHDTVFFYTRSTDNSHTFNQQFMERAPSTLKRFGTAKIVSGYDEQGRRIPSQTEDAESDGVRMDDVWDISRVAPIKQLYPTEKPLALLERIIEASSNPGDMVLDPFCGCGTAVVAAQKLGREWCGIDITTLAVSLIKKRLLEHFPEAFPSPDDIRVEGFPVDVAGARTLAEADRHAFEHWALTLLGAAPAVQKKKGADRGIDGEFAWRDGADKQQRGLVSVKSGHVNVTHIRDLRGTMEREGAVMGVLVTLHDPTAPMRTECAGAGRYQVEGLEKHFPRLQIVTVAELLAGQEPDLPRWRLNPFKQAKAIQDKGGQQSLFGEDE